MDDEQKQCDCTDKCLGYLTKTCKRKEDQKQLLIDMMRYDEELGLYNNNTAIGMHTLTDTTTGCNSSRFGKKEIVKDLAYWKANAEEDYMKVPISVLRYISELENQMYSEENMKKAFKSGRMVKNYKAEWEETYSDEMTSCKYKDFKQWFEQFKKK